MRVRYRRQSQQTIHLWKEKAKICVRNLEAALIFPLLKTTLNASRTAEYALYFQSEWGFANQLWIAAKQSVIDLPITRQIFRDRIPIMKNIVK